MQFYDRSIVHHSNPGIIVQKCSGRPECKNDTEIEEFMDSTKFIVNIIEYRYDSNAYGTDDQIRKSSKK